MTHEKRTITYITQAEITMDDLLSLYSSVGWSAYTDHPDKMAKLLSGAVNLISAWDGDHLVGLVRALSDNASIVYVQDILVHPEFQRKGIGRHLLDSLLKDYAHIRQIVLMTDNTEKTKAFYQSLGFSAAEDVEAVAFIRMNHTV
ncbi:MAG: GNAT family N-acetyltransferase [Alkalibacterium sp.]|nr:GNAT family N-acetyltransferase [Alkalibacterium sp.]